MEIRGLVPLLEVFNMPAAIDFYQRVLQFELVETAGPPEDIGWALLRRNGIELMLNTAYEATERPVNPDPARVAAHSDTTLYFGCPDVDAAYAQLRAQGLDSARPVVAHYGMKQLYVRDPDGYSVCFQWPANGL